MSAVLVFWSSYTPTSTGGRPTGVMQSATLVAPGSHEFGEASITDGLPQAAVSHAKPSDVSNGRVGLWDSFDVAPVGCGVVGAGRAQATRAVQMIASATSAIVPEAAVRARREVGSSCGGLGECVATAMRSCLPHRDNNGLGDQSSPLPSAPQHAARHLVGH